MPTCAPPWWRAACAAPCRRSTCERSAWCGPLRIELSKVGERTSVWSTEDCHQRMVSAWAHTPPLYSTTLSPTRARRSLVSDVNESSSGARAARHLNCALCTHTHTASVQGSCCTCIVLCAVGALLRRRGPPPPFAHALLRPL